MSLKIGSLLEIGPVRGASLQFGPRQLTPVAWTVAVRMAIPRMPAACGFVWTRPLAVEVLDAESLRRIPILDLGTSLMLSLFAAAALSGITRLLLKRDWSRIPHGGTGNERTTG